MYLNGSAAVTGRWGWDRHGIRTLVLPGAFAGCRLDGAVLMV
jgi:hypothetical protein